MKTTREEVPHVVAHRDSAKPDGGRAGLVSVIIPVYNRPELLREAVASALCQSYRPIEILIVDDGSTDSTSDVAVELSRSSPDVVSTVRIDNRGPGLARETGRMNALGEFVQYLDSDDLLLPGKFEVQVAGLRAHPECGVSYGWTQYCRSDGTVVESPWKGSGVRHRTMFPSFLKERWWDTPTPLYRASLLDRVGPWSDLRLEEDWEYDTRVASQGVQLHYCETFVAQVRDHDSHRLGRGTPTDKVRQKERARAHTLIYRNAVRGGIRADAPEMIHFSRELFLLCRQCGYVGLDEEAIDLFRLAREAAGPGRGNGPDFVLYGAVASIIGWRNAGRLARVVDRLRA